MLSFFLEYLFPILISIIAYIFKQYNLFYVINDFINYFLKTNNKLNYLIIFLTSKYDYIL